MKVRSLWLAPCAAVAVAAVAWLASARPALGANADEDAIRALDAKFVAAWNRHDAKAMASVWAEDGDLINPMGQYARGRADIEKLIAAEHGSTGAMRECKGTIAAETVRILSPDVAVADWEFHVSGVLQPKSTQPQNLVFHVTTVLRKVGGSWAVFAARPYAEASGMKPAPSTD